MKKVLIGLMCLFFLAGCGPTLGMGAWKELKESKTIYKECLMRHPENPKKCEGLRRAYEADMKAYRAIMGYEVGGTIDETLRIEEQRK